MTSAGLKMPPPNPNPRLSTVAAILATKRATNRTKGKLAVRADSVVP
jgi:hypothetical protein